MVGTTDYRSFIRSSPALAPLSAFKAECEPLMVRLGRIMSDLKTIRTDVVGSLLRPIALKQARVRFDEGQISAGEFRAIEDDAKQSTLHGYERRVEGAAPLQRWEVPTQEVGTAISHRRPTRERLRLSRNIPLEEYRFVSKRTKKPAKVSLIGPDRISQRFDHQASTAVYETVEAFVGDVVAIEREIVESLVAAGCRYIHIDAPGFTAYVDAPSLEQMRARGEDPAKNFDRSIKAEAKVEGLGDVTTAIHICRGNQRSMWHREGSYDTLAERLFTELPHDRFLLEYDSPRAGNFAPLRFVPKDKVVVLGLISTKIPEMEKVDALKRRIGEAAKFIPLEQLAISPQCGFASDVVGNLLSVDDQKRKLELVAETARQVWG